MTNGKACSVASLVLLAACASLRDARAATPTHAMTVQDLTTTDAQTTNTATVWQDQITANNASWTQMGLSYPSGQNAPFYASSAVFGTGANLVFVSVGSSSDLCQANPNSSSFVQVYSTCSARLAYVSGGKLKVVDEGSACFVNTSDTSIDSAQNNEMATYDAASRTVNLTVIQNGTQVPDCSRSFTVP